MAKRARIVGVDFDGTLVTHEYPKIGKPLPYAFETLIKLREKGVRVFLWTMRGHPDLKRFPHLDIRTGKYIPTDTLQEAVDFCKNIGLEFDGINESPEQFSTSNKQYAHVYIDDTALGCPLNGPRSVDWLGVIRHLLWLGFLTLEDCQEIFGVTSVVEVLDLLGLPHETPSEEV